MTSNNDIILGKRLVGDIKGQFYIPSLQWGYRWTDKEVIRLLDDVYQNGKNSYCLKPVVVRRKAGYYELVDGQQMLTTIYLIYKCMKSLNPFFNDPAFSITYETRTSEFLKTLDFSKKYEYIDFWFIANAYETIQKWFEDNLPIRFLKIFEYFKLHVKTIWYEVGENEDTVLYSHI